MTKNYLVNGTNLINTPPKEWYNNYMALDVETTGLEVQDHTIIEIGISHQVNGKETETFSTLTNPYNENIRNIKLPQEIIDTTHITEDMLFDVPTLEETTPQIKEFIGNTPIIGHNITFDLKFLDKIFKIYLNDICDNNYIDTQEVSYFCYISDSYKLDKLCEKLGIPDPQAHRALNDARAEAQLLKHMFEEFEIEKDPIEI